MFAQLFETYLTNIPISKNFTTPQQQKQLGHSTSTTLGELTRSNDFLLFYIFSSSAPSNPVFLRALQQFLATKSQTPRDREVPKKRNFNATTSPTKFKRLFGLNRKPTINEVENSVNMTGRISTSAIVVDIEFVPNEANLTFVTELGLFYFMPDLYLSKSRLLRALNFVNGPSLFVLECAKLCIVSQVYRSLMDDQEGNQFPWANPSFNELFNCDLLQNSQTGGAPTRANISTAGKGVKGLFFGAKWCPPSRQLCKQLCEIYPKLKQQHADAFEIIFCSYDRSEESFREHFSTMPWLSFPYGNQKALSKAYDIHGIPTFLLVDENFSVITRNGLNMLLSNPNGYPWPRKPLYELCEFTAHLLSEMPSLILFTEGSPEDTEFSIQFLNSCAQSIHGTQQQTQMEGTDGCPLQVFYTGEDPICDYILESLGQEQADLPLLLICDVMTGHLAICDKPDVSEQILTGFVDDYRAGRAKVEPIPNQKQRQQQSRTVAGIPADIIHQLVIQQSATNDQFAKSA